jgi:choline dehydrogenase-like flavoprotein
MPRLICDWRQTEMDRKTAVEMAIIVGSEFGRLNLGRVQLVEWLQDDSDLGWSGSNHHMGTTRMANDPRKGVVNSDCRVHGMGNFYVAGSSVFPTTGFVNPAFTIVALALRLADHLC